MGKYSNPNQSKAFATVNSINCISFTLGGCLGTNRNIASTGGQAKVRNFDRRNRSFSDFIIRKLENEYGFMKFK
jgi:hypothetical protein